MLPELEEGYRSGYLLAGFGCGLRLYLAVNGRPPDSRLGRACYPWLLPPIRLRIGLKQRALAFDPTHGVVVQEHAPDAAVFGQRPGLRPDRLGGKYALDGSEQRVAVQ